MNARGRIEQIIQLGIVLMLLIAPFPFGSVEPLWIFLMEAAVSCLLLLWIGSQLAAGQLSLVKSRIWLLSAAVLIYVLWTLLPLPLGIHRIISAETYRIYQSAEQILAPTGSQLHAAYRITLNAFETEGELLKLACYLGFFFLAIHALRRPSRFIAVYRLIIVIGTFVALLGIAQSVWSNGRIYWQYESGSGTHFGPFVNHNHCAGYLQLALGLCLGMLVAEIQEFRNNTQGQGMVGYFAWLWHRNGARCWLLFCSLFVMLAALAASLSRGGFISFTLTFLVFGFLALFTRTKTLGLAPSRRQISYFRIFASVCLAGILLWIGLIGLTPRGRVRWQTVLDRPVAHRMEIWRDGARALLDFPVTGIGLGSFRVIYPHYQSGSNTSEATHAENEYLQWAMETGGVGVALLLAAAIGFIAAVVSRLKRRRDPYFRLLAYGAIFSLTSVCIHNWIDFNMHVPSNALTFMAAAALCFLAVICHRGAGGCRCLCKTYEIPLRSRTGVILLAGITLAAAALGQRAAVRYYSVQLTEKWTNHSKTAGLVDSDLRSLFEAVHWMPTNARAYYLAAQALERSAARTRLFDMARKRRMLDQAQGMVLPAIILQPSESSRWALLGRITAEKQEFSTSLEAFEHALWLAHTNGYIRRDYGIALVQAGRIQDGVAQLAIARNYAPDISLRELLAYLSTRTSDRTIWERLVRYQPEDMRSYGDLLRKIGLINLGNQMWAEAETLDKLLRRSSK
jgi:O-antigen ligase